MLCEYGSVGSVCVCVCVVVAFFDSCLAPVANRSRVAETALALGLGQWHSVSAGLGADADILMPDAPEESHSG